MFQRVEDSRILSRKTRQRLLKDRRRYSMFPVSNNSTIVSVVPKRRVYALSIKQPWAALVASGRKTIEVRSWLTRLRGRILIHAARVPDNRAEAWKWVSDAIRPLTELRGGIIGETELVACQAYRDQESFTVDGDKHLNEPSWFQPKGLYGFVFRDAALIPFRPFSGNVRFFTVEDVR